MRKALALIAAALSPTLASPALAACSAQNTYSYSFNWGSNTSLNYATTYTYTASNPLGATSNFTTSFATNNLSSSLVAGVQMPAVQNLLSGVAGGRTLMIGGTFSGRTVNIAANARTIRTTFTFATPIRDLTITVHDIDFTSNQYRDWLMVTGSNGASTYTPSMVSPLGPNNNAGPASGGGSSVAFNGYNSGGVSVTSRDRSVGIGSSPNTNSNVGDIVISFAEPVTSVTLRYGNYPFTAGESTTGQQAYGISTITFCPMPNVSIAKSSAPLATTGPDRFNTPGSEVVYTLMVTNSGGSPVDLDGLVIIDALPATMTFYNGDFDTGAPGTDPFSLTAGSSGVTLTAANVSYSNNGGSTYTYVPAAGFDPAVDRVRFAPGGSLAANSSFTIRFRALVE